MDIFLQALWAIAPGIIVGVVLAAWNRRQKCRTERYEQQEQERIQSEQVKISLLVATAQLSHAVAMAYKRGAPNGEMETAIQQYAEAMDRFRTFERQQMAKNSL